MSPCLRSSRTPFLSWKLIGELHTLIKKSMHGLSYIVNGKVKDIWCDSSNDQIYETQVTFTLCGVLVKEMLEDC